MPEVPDIALVRTRLGPDARLEPAPHWIRGRRGLTYIVTRDSGQRSVFQWRRQKEMICARDLLLDAPIATPALYRWWNAEPGVPAAVEMEYISHLATPGPCYRFSPDHLPLTDPAWRGVRLEAALAQLGTIHAHYSGADRHKKTAGLLHRCSLATDLQNWQADLTKLRAIAPRPGASEWIRFWDRRAVLWEKLLERLYAFPLTWIWEDAKWDHLGCREDGAVVFLEWSTTLGPAGSDLFLLLFESQARRTELLELYMQHAAGMMEKETDLREYIRLGLMRACFVHGVGQACLSLRGCAGTPRNESDTAAWSADAAATAAALQELERE